MSTEKKDNIFNLTEGLAEEEISFVMKKMGLEETKANRDDVLALALNYLPAKYVTTDEGKQYAKLIEVYRVQYDSDVVAALTKACIKVMQSPRSSDNKENNK